MKDTVLSCSCWKTGFKGLFVCQGALPTHHRQVFLLEHILVLVCTQCKCPEALPILTFSSYAISSRQLRGCLCQGAPPALDRQGTLFEQTLVITQCNVLKRSYSMHRASMQSYSMHRASMQSSLMHCASMQS